MIAALSAWHEQHEAAARAVAGVTALPAHVMVEAYSVLTRLPGGLAVPAATASKLLLGRFDAPPLRLPGADASRLVARLADAGVIGGASYDGLVALEAQANGSVLATLDRRAQGTYVRLGVPFEAVA